MKIFLAGDVMTGRAIDALMPVHCDGALLDGTPSSPSSRVRDLHERFAELPVPLEATYIWGDSLQELQARAPDVRLINLETAITTCDDIQAKQYNFRTHPANLSLLDLLKIDSCALANNHTMDWGPEGLLETRRHLHEAGIRAAGAGRDLGEAQSPAVISRPDGGRLLVFSLTLYGAGSPVTWRATETRAGQWLLPVFSTQMLEEVRAVVRRHRRAGDIVVISAHWGGNWGTFVHPILRDFVHSLIDSGDVDLVHGHSSHHVKPIEVYKGRLVLYGCGDFMNDYGSGDRGRRHAHRLAKYRPELELGYFADVDSTGALSSLEMVPFRLDRLHLQLADQSEAEWLAAMLAREGKVLGTSVDLLPDRSLALRW